jgi:hypothetical protein
LPSLRALAIVLDVSHHSLYAPTLTFSDNRDDVLGSACDTRGGTNGRPTPAPLRFESEARLPGYGIERNDEAAIVDARSAKAPPGPPPPLSPRHRLDQRFRL